MCDRVSALPGARFGGFCEVAEAGRVGMVTLKGDLGAAEFAAAVRGVSGFDLPARGEMTDERDGVRLAWMAPDEAMLFCPADAAPGMAQDLSAALSGLHALAVDVSDARAVFRVTGVGAREVMAKLTPADVAPGAFGPGRLRRTRLGQVPAAFFMPDQGSFTVIAFRSVAGYVFDLLSNAARPGSEVGLFVAPQ